MEDLPIPLSRVELYLAKIAGMDVTIPEEPMSRLEQFLAVLAGDAGVEMPTPLSLTEQWLSCVYYGTISNHPAVEGAHYIDNQKVDTRYLAVASGVVGVTLPAAPQNRKEQYWAVIATAGPIHGVLKYVTGSNLTLTDVVSGIEELQFVYGDTYQQTYSGKNLFNINAPQQPNTRCTGTIEGNSVTVTSTVNGTGFYSIILPNSDSLFGKTVTISFGEVVSSHTARVVAFEARQVQPNNVGGWSKVISASHVVTGGSEKFTFPDSHTGSYDSFAVVVYVGNQGSATVVGDYTTYSNIQLELGSTATTYEPYVGGGGIASPNPDYPQDVQVVTGEQTVKVSGKNIVNLQDYSSSGVTGSINGDGSITISGTATSTGGVLVMRSQQLLKAGIYTMTISKPLPFLINFSIASGVRFRIPAGDTSVTTTLSEDYINGGLYMAMTAGTVYNETFNLQIVAGSTPDYDFRPHHLQSYTIDLGSIELCNIGNYQDYIYKSGVDWYVHKATGKDTLPTSGYYLWETHTTACMYYRNYDVPEALFQNGSTALKCRDFVCKAQILNMTEYYNSYHDDGYGITLKTQTHGIAIQNIKQTTLTDFHTWIGDNPITLYYALATPTDTQITDATLISQLNVLDTAVLPKPVAYITVGAASGNLPAPLKISYYGRAE